MAIGEKLKTARLQAGLTVEELAKKIGKNRATLYRYENSEIEKLPSNVLTSLCLALNVTPAYLMGWDTETEPQTIGEIIIKARQKKGISQGTLADMLDINPSTIMRYENGEVTNINRIFAQRLAEALDIDAEKLIHPAQGSANANNTQTIINSTVALPVVSEQTMHSDLTSIKKTFEVPLSYINYGSKDDYFFFEITDDSKAPIYQKADMILVEKKNTAGSNDKYILVNDNGKAIITDTTDSTNSNILGIPKTVVRMI